MGIQLCGYSTEIRNALNGTIVHQPYFKWYYDHVKLTPLPWTEHIIYYIDSYIIDYIVDNFYERIPIS